MILSWKLIEEKYQDGENYSFIRTYRVDLGDTGYLLRTVVISKTHTSASTSFIPSAIGGTDGGGISSEPVKDIAPDEIEKSSADIVANETSTNRPKFVKVINRCGLIKPSQLSYDEKKKVAASRAKVTDAPSVLIQTIKNNDLHPYAKSILNRILAHYGASVENLSKVPTELLSDLVHITSAKGLFRYSDKRDSEHPQK